MTKISARRKWRWKKPVMKAAMMRRGRANEKGSLPELQAHWQRHETNPLAMPPAPDQAREEAKGALPLWLQPQSDKKD